MSRVPPWLKFIVGAYGSGLVVVVVGAVFAVALDQTNDRVMRILGELARGTSWVVSFGLMFAGAITGFVAVTDIVRGRHRVVRKPPPGMLRFVELIVVWGVAFASVAAVLAPGVEEALVTRGALPPDAPGTESSLAVVLGTVGVAFAAAKWFMDSTVWVRAADKAPGT